MSQTARDIRAAFIAIEGSNPERLHIDTSHPHADTAAAMIDAAGSHYGYNLGALEWAYAAVPRCLDYLSDVALDTAPADHIRELAHEGADSLTDLYTHDLRQWFYDYPAVFDQEENELDELGGIENAPNVIAIIQACQYQAYAAVFYAIADHWPDNESEYCPECTEEEPAG